MQHICGIKAKFNVQQITAADFLKAAREADERGEARGIEILGPGIAVNMNSLADVRAAGNRVRLAGFVVIVDDVILRSVGERTGHDHAGNDRICNHGLDKNLIVVFGLAIRGDDFVYGLRERAAIICRNIEP